MIYFTLDINEFNLTKLVLICSTAGVEPMFIKVKLFSSKIKVAVRLGRLSARPSTIYVFLSVSCIS